MGLPLHAYQTLFLSPHLHIHWILLPHWLSRGQPLVDKVIAALEGGGGVRGGGGEEGDRPGSLIAKPINLYDNLHRSFVP